MTVNGTFKKAICLGIYSALMSGATGALGFL